MIHLRFEKLMQQQIESDSLISRVLAAVLIEYTKTNSGQKLSLVHIHVQLLIINCFIFYFSALTMDIGDQQYE